MVEKQLIKTICLEPEYLDNNIQMALLNKVRKTWVGKCTKEDGYILSIDRILEISNNYISTSNNSVVFELIISATILKPEIGMQYIAKIDKIHPHGLFAYVDNRLKIVIPSTKLNEYILTGDTYTHKIHSDITLNLEGLIKIEITALRYEKSKFDCIAKIA